MPSDTSPEAAAIQAEIFRRMTPAERVKMALEMSEEMRQLAVYAAFTQSLMRKV